jgi:hypothetical protein
MNSCLFFKDTKEVWKKLQQTSLGLRPEQRQNIKKRQAKASQPGNESPTGQLPT